MASGPDLGPENLFALKSHVERLHEDARFAVTDFQPEPLGDVRGRTVYLATTAPQHAAARQAAQLETTHGCRVIGFTTALADRGALAREMDEAGEYQVLLTELKAAAVDVAAERARARGAEVVFLHNRPVDTGDAPPLRAQVEEILQIAADRYHTRA
jgi:cyclic 2,3-diphosphoglycerate synthetase